MASSVGLARSTTGKHKKRIILSIVWFFLVRQGLERPFDLPDGCIELLLGPILALLGKSLEDGLLFCC
jgi:hypothetical protein